MLNTAELKELGQYVRQKCSCLDDSDKDVNVDNKNIENESQETADNKKKKEFIFPIEDKSIFIDFNKKITDSPKYCNRLVKYLKFYFFDALWY